MLESSPVHRLRTALHRFALSGLCLLFVACTPAACNEEESVIGRELEILIGEPGPAVKEAERRLLARGSSAIAILETGLYQADPIGRVRIAKLLAAIGDPEVIPILQHMASRDEDALVREQANLVLRRVHGAVKVSP